MARRHPVIKVALGLAALAVLGFLFARTLTTVSSEPYTIPPGHLGPWTVEVGALANPDTPVLYLRPPEPLSMGVFDQVFQRTMESYTSPAQPGIPLVLYRELRPALSTGGGIDDAGPVSPLGLLQVARDVGLDGVTLSPTCVAVYRTEGGREERLFFVLFDHPPFAAFRQTLGERLEELGAAAGYEADALSPAMLIAASDARRLTQIPPRPALEQACEAPIASGE